MKTKEVLNSFSPVCFCGSLVVAGSKEPFFPGERVGEGWVKKGVVVG